MRISWSRFLKESLLWPRVSRMLFIINQAGFFEHVSSTCAPLKPTNKKSRSHALTPFLPKSDKHTITPNSTDPESNVKVGRIAETITNLRSFDCWTNSLRQYQRKWTEKMYGELAYRCYGVKGWKEKSKRHFHVLLSTQPRAHYVSNGSWQNALSIWLFLFLAGLLFCQGVTAVLVI